MPQHSRVGHALGAIACAILLGLASGCASTSIEDAAPTASASTLPESAPRPAGAQRGTASATDAAAAIEAEGPKDTGTFPNLNIPPKVAADQITDDQKAAQTTDLRATQQGAATTAAGLGQGMTDPALLRKIAAQHAADALKKIKAQN
jgi:hypothetical protein